MVVAITDEQLAAWEQGIIGKKGYAGSSYPGSADVRAIIQEVRRLREPRDISEFVSAIAKWKERAEKAEAETELLRELLREERGNTTSLVGAVTEAEDALRYAQEQWPPGYATKVASARRRLATAVALLNQQEA